MALGSVCDVAVVNVSCNQLFSRILARAVERVISVISVFDESLLLTAHVLVQVRKVDYSV